MLQAVLELTKHAETGKDIFDKSQNWLARGHLAPDASFVYQEEADATYFYINVAPQFQSFNNQNWKSLEKITRDIAIRYVVIILVILCGLNTKLLYAFIIY